MRISDWSSDVCSSDLRLPAAPAFAGATARALQRPFEPALERAFRRRADLGLGDLAILEQDHRRDAAHAIFGGSVRMVVDVELGDHHLAVQLDRKSTRLNSSH